MKLEQGDRSQLLWTDSKGLASHVTLLQQKRKQQKSLMAPQRPANILWRISSWARAHFARWMRQFSAWVDEYWEKKRNGEKGPNLDQKAVKLRNFLLLAKVCNNEATNSATNARIVTDVLENF